MKRTGIAYLVGVVFTFQTVVAGCRMAAVLIAVGHGGGTLAAGAVVAMYSVAALVVLPLSSRLATRHSHVSCVRLATTVLLCGLLLCRLSIEVPSFQFLCLMLGAILVGASNNIVLVASQLCAGRRENSQQARLGSFAWLSVAPALANGVGPLIVGFTADTYGYGLTYVVFFSVAIVPALFGGFKRVSSQSLPVPIRRTARSRILRLFKRPELRRLLILNLALNTCWDLHEFAVPLIGHSLGFSVTTIGAIMASFSIAVLSVRLLLPRLAFLISSPAALHGSLVAAALVLILYPVFSSVAPLCVLAFLLGIILGVGQPLILTRLFDIAPPSKHSDALAVRSASINGFAGILPITFGLGVGAVGLTPVFIGVAILAIAVCIGVRSPRHLISAADVV